MKILLISGLFSTAESYGKETATAEIIIMLLIAFILGYLLRYFLTIKKLRDYDSLLENHQILKKELETLKNKQKELEKELDRYKSKNNQLIIELEDCRSKYNQITVALDECNKNKQLGIANISEKKGTLTKDDLKIIEGIGPKIEQLLYAEGIYTWNDLAQTEVKIIRTILDNAGPRYRVHNPESWPFQAKMAADGKWKELEKWQEEHKGGRF